MSERLDPYSGRWKPREARTERLAELVRRERGVEGVVRGRTWGVVVERCGGLGEGDEEGWEKAMERWRREGGRTGEGEREGE